MREFFSTWKHTWEKRFPVTEWQKRTVVKHLNEMASVVVHCSNRQYQIYEKIKLKKEANFK